MSHTPHLEKIRAEQAAFDTYDGAYEAGLGECGSNEPFLVSEVRERGHEPVSLSPDWV